MSGWLERRRLAKEEARQRAIASDLAANDLIAMQGPVKPRPPLPDPTPEPAAPPVAAQDPVTQADHPSPWAAPVDAEPTPPAEPASRPEPSPRPEPVAAPVAPATAAAATTTPASTDPDGACRQLLELPGALAAAVVDATSGMSLAAHGDAGFDLDAGAAAAGEVLLAHRDLLGDDAVTDAVITTRRRHLLLRTGGWAAEGLLVYLVLDAGRGNLAAARRRLDQVAAGLTA